MPAHTPPDTVDGSGRPAPSSLKAAIAAIDSTKAPAVTHIRYTVTGRSKLVLDDRGAGGDLVGPPER